MINRFRLGDQVKRLTNTLKFVLSKMHTSRIWLGITPFKALLVDADGLLYLKSRVATDLAKRGEIICLPADRMISNYVQNYGQWGLDEGAFLAKVADNYAFKNNLRVVLLDLGAHAGLVSKIYLSHLKYAESKIILVDPLPANNKAQRFNFRNNPTDVISCEKVIAQSSGQVSFDMNFDNIGASKISVKSTNISNTEQIQVAAISVNEFEMDYLTGNEKILIKSDLEGMDAEILNAFSRKTWDRVIGGVVEVESSPSYSKISRNLVDQHLGNFSLSWSPRFWNSLDPEEVIQDWQSSDGLVKNLFFKLD